MSNKEWDKGIEALNVKEANSYQACAENLPASVRIVLLLLLLLDVDVSGALIVD